MSKDSRAIGPWTPAFIPEDERHKEPGRVALRAWRRHRRDGGGPLVVAEVVEYMLLVEAGEDDTGPIVICAECSWTDAAGWRHFRGEPLLALTPWPEARRRGGAGWALFEADLGLCWGGWVAPGMSAERDDVLGLVDAECAARCGQ